MQLKSWIDQQVDKRMVDMRQGRLGAVEQDSQSPLVDSTRADFRDFWILLEKINVYISFGFQDLSKNLNRIGGIELGVDFYQNDHILVQQNQRAF